MCEKFELMIIFTETKMQLIQYMWQTSVDIITPNSVILIMVELMMTC